MFKDKLVRDALHKDNKLEDVYGVEIEVELAKAIDQNPLPAFWKLEGDGSLRGNGYEFVLKKPMSQAGAKKAVVALLNELNKDNQVIDNGRAGVHIHVNAGNLTVTQMVNQVALSLTHEDLLTHYCGEYRLGNLFCLRMRDAEYILDLFNQALVSENLGVLHTDRIRYAFLNLKALTEYGSLEYRAMRSDGNAEAICNWIDMLARIKAMAVNLDNPQQVVAQVSHRTPEGFLRDVMGPLEDLLPKYEGWQDEMMESIRRVQVFAYSKDW